MKTSPLLRSLLAPSVAVLFGISLSAQDALRAWSAFTMDTDAYRLPALEIDTEWHLTAVLRADGRIYVHGSESGLVGICRPPEPPPGLHFTTMAVNKYNGLGILSDGSMVHWHSNYLMLSPPPALPAGLSYVRASVGWDHALALRSDGMLLGWSNGLGAVQAAVPPFPSGVSVLKFKAATLCSMVLLSNGTIQGWGYNYYGELNIPPLPPNATYIDLWAGGFHFLAKRSDGAIVSWGDNGFGQSNLPSLPAGVTYVDFGLGMEHTVALRSDGQLVAWGQNLRGQCNLTPLPPGRTVVQLDASDFTTLARLSDGSVVGWGGPFGELPLPVSAANARFVDVTTGYGCAIGLASDGQTSGYGANEPWLLTPPTCPQGLQYTKVYLGWRHAGALRSDGQLIMWGDNQYGRATAPPLPPGTHYVHASLGDRTTYALRSDGTVLAFGYPTVIPPIPVLPGGVRYVQVDVEIDTSVLLRSDGLIELGGTGAPAPPPAMAFVDVAAGYYHRAALRSDGQVLAWQGNGTAFPVPPLPPGVVYVDVDCGYYDLVARRSDGAVVVSMQANSSGEELVPALRQGESYVQIDATGYFTVGRVGPTRTYVSYASGCAGALQPSRLVPRDTPCIGRTHTVRLFDLPQDCAFMVFGWNRTQPTSLASQGAPGCFQHVSIDAAIFLSGQNGQAVFELPIPDWPGLVGLHYYNQAVVFDPAANTIGAVVSDAAEGVIGHR